MPSIISKRRKYAITIFLLIIGHMVISNAFSHHFFANFIRSIVHDLLEQGVYDTNTFLDCVREIGDRLAIEADLQLEEAWEESRRDIIPKVERLLDVYKELPTPKAKNDLLKEVLEKVVYIKEERGERWNSVADASELTLYPKLPQG